MRSSYDKWEDAVYDSQPISFQQPFVQKYLREDEIRGKAVLDLGCGTGKLIQILLDHKPLSVTGIDISHRAISLCRERFSEYDNVHFILADVTQLDLGLQFDLVVSYGCLNVLPLNDSQKLELLARLVKKGGTVVFDAIPKTFYNLSIFTLAKIVIRTPFKWAIFRAVGPLLNRTLSKQYYGDLASLPLGSLKYRYWLDARHWETVARSHGFKIEASEYRKVGSVLAPVKFRCKMEVTRVMEDGEIAGS